MAGQGAWLGDPEGLTAPSIVLFIRESVFCVNRSSESMRTVFLVLPLEATTIEAPAGFITLGQGLKLGILVREARGNQTLSSAAFATKQINI